jgi:CII-binding regulator of phage lambda lysogenization HflD
MKYPITSTTSLWLVLLVSSLVVGGATESSFLVQNGTNSHLRVVQHGNDEDDGVITQLIHRLLVLEEKSVEQDHKIHILEDELNEIKSQRRHLQEESNPCFEYIDDRCFFNKITRFENQTLYVLHVVVRAV